MKGRNMEIKFIMARSVTGFALGDAVGVPYEFKKRGTFLCEDMRGSRFGDAHFCVPKGSWSDDTALLLCVLDSLQEDGRTAIYEKFRKNAIGWLYFGKFTNHGIPLAYDVGKACERGIDAMFWRRENPKAADVQSNGNGGLMRILPLVFVPFSEDSNNEEILDAIRLFNACSHDHLISHVCCLFYVLLGKQLVKGLPFEEAFGVAVHSVDEIYRIPELNRIWSGEILFAQEAEVRSTGYVVDTLEAAVWSCAKEKDFKQTILRAVNLGCDTDTIAAIAGGLAGIMYKELPDDWVRGLRKLYMIQNCCNRLGIIEKNKF